MRSALFARSTLSLVTILMLCPPVDAAARKKASRVLDVDDRPRLAARSLPCGTALTPQDVAAFRARGPVDLEAGPGGAQEPYFVPIAPHIIRQDDGSGGLPDSRYHQAVADANLHYAPQNISFYTAGPIDYIDSDAFYFDIDTIDEINAMRTTNPVPNTINIYFTPNLDYEGGALCGISAFTTSEVQAIAMRNSCTATSTNHSTFSHEIGHYFDLFHTHETAFGDELVDGSNCETAGDVLCDTPADPRLTSSTVDPDDCTYTGSELDPQGDPYDPDPTQLMSYSLKHCRDNFTPQSLERAEITLVNERPELLLNAVAVHDGLSVEAGELFLSAPRPNPTGRHTEMTLSLAQPGHVEATVYDVRGVRIRTIAYGLQLAGEHRIGWDGLDESGSRVAPGIYFARVAALGRTAARKIQILR